MITSRQITAAEKQHQQRVKERKRELECDRDKI